MTPNGVVINGVGVNDVNTTMLHNRNITNSLEAIAT